VRKKGGLLVVPDDGGGLTEQVHDGKDGFVIHDPENGLLSVLETIRSSSLDPIREAGVDRVFSGGYTWSSRIMETLSHLYEDVAGCRGEALSEIRSVERQAL
jgi:hypothetical protein